MRRFGARVLLSPGWIGVAETALRAESSAVSDIEQSQVAIGAIFDGHGRVVSVAYARVSSSTGMVRMPAVCRSYSAKPG